MKGESQKVYFLIVPFRRLDTSARPPKTPKTLKFHPHIGQIPTKLHQIFKSRKKSLHCQKVHFLIVTPFSIIKNKFEEDGSMKQIFNRLLLVVVGFCCLVLPSPAEDKSDASFTKYTSANLNLRSASNTKSKVLTVIPKGASVTIAEDCDCKWILVSYNGYIGYVSSKYLSKQKPITPIYRYVYPKYYKNRDGDEIQSPTPYNSAPVGATALCRDETYSFSINRRGTCSHHGGVASWFAQDRYGTR